MRVLVTGATGYVGGRLVPELIARGYTVRCMARQAERLIARGWNAEIIEGDALAPETLGPAFADVDVAYYLIHSLGSGKGFASRDVTAAQNFARAAAAAGVRRIVYLGGLGGEHDALSEHLRSRQETGAALRSTGVPVTEFRAGIIIGSGSLSFELLRYLTERLPWMITPVWLRTLAQPIGIRDVLRYLAETPERPETTGRTFEICGPDILTYQDMVQRYAAARGLRPRRMLQVPVLSPRVSSYWVHWVTPIPTHIAMPLIEGLRNRVTCSNPAAKEVFGFEPMPFNEALRLALEKLKAGDVPTSWADALSTNLRYQPHKLEREVVEGLVLERQARVLAAPQQAVFAAVLGLGGARGWLVANLLWKIRGWIDRALGGVGLQRGRRVPDQLRVGDRLDWWRVEALVPSKLLRLHAEMRVPGEAWLEFTLAPAEEGRATLLTQTAYYAPRGLAGHLYWWAMWPAHRVIFPGMVRAIGRRARKHLNHGG